MLVYYHVLLLIFAWPEMTRANLLRFESATNFAASQLPLQFNRTELFGSSLAVVSGNIIAVGGPLANAESGAVYLMRLVAQSKLEYVMTLSMAREICCCTAVLPLDLQSLFCHYPEVKLRVGL